MAASQDRKRLRTKGQVWLSLVFFLLCYLYLWLFVQPHLIYDGFGTIVLDVPVFAAGWQSLRDSLGVPGGLTVYLYGFLSQGFYYSWLGALLVVLVALCIWELARRHYVYTGHPGPAVLPYFPAIMILLMYNRYDHPFAACLALSMGLLFSLVFEWVPLHRAPIRMVVFCLMAAISYWLAGAGAAFIFALMTAVCLLRRRDWLPALVVLPVTAVIIWVLADYVFFLSPKQAFLALTPFGREWTAGLKTLSRVLVVLLYAFVPVTVLLICLWRRVAGRSGATDVVRPTKTSGKTRATRRSARVSLAYLKRLALSAAPVAVLALGFYLSCDKIHRQIIVMNALSREGRWSEVLELGQRLPTNVYNIYCNHDIDRALFRAGRLGYDMLCFPQNPHALLLTHEQDESCMTQAKMCDAFLELGNVDLAQKLASEFLVTQGNLGLVLEKLAWINIIKGQEDTARVYLHALKKDLLWRDRADSMLSGLENGFGPDEAAYIRQVRSYIRRRDDGRLDRESIAQMLTGLLEQNGRNRMAFEYLMACYLLAGQMDKIAANVGRLEDLGYREIPTLYEEAMLIYYGSRHQQPDLSKLNINRRTIERYERFLQLNDSMQAHNRQAVLQRLVQEFGTSYFFYYRFTVSSPAANP